MNVEDITGPRAMRRLQLASRFAWVGLLVSSVAITALAVWSTFDTLRLTETMQRVATLSDGWKQVRFWIAEEETLERKYRIERVRHDRAYHDEAVRIVNTTVARLRPLSTPDDNHHIDQLLENNARYARAIDGMFRAVDAGDERRVEAIHEAIDPTYDNVEHAAIFEEQKYHRSAYYALAQLRKTQRQLASGFPILGAIGFFALGTFVIVLREYQKRSDQVTRLQLADLEHTARKDALTGLGNSRAFGEMLDGIRLVAIGTQSSLHLALIDVDNFKRVNDRHGHLHGDTILRKLGALLNENHANAGAYRVGGDEFALAFTGQAIDSVASALRALHDGANASLGGNTLSIGVASLPSGDRDAEALHERADVALYEAKHRGRNTTVFFEPSLLLTSKSIAARRVAFERMLADPTPLDIVLQPIWRLVDGELAGYEALTRFPSDFATPQEAFAVAERLERVHELDAKCLASIAARLPERLDHTVHVNLSAATLENREMAAAALAVFCDRTALEPSRVVLEVTEQGSLSNDVLTAVGELRAQGYRIALDDVGSQNAGLAVLASLPLDIVKIDGILLAAVEHDPRARAVMAGVFLIVEQLGRSLVVEGVETEGQIRYCRALAAEYGLAERTSLQGYALGYPLPPERWAPARRHPSLGAATMDASSVDSDCGAVV